ncbi:MAG: hypothetical protein ACYS67_08050, partial [Planctomycetota bacterium]
MKVPGHGDTTKSSSGFLRDAMKDAMPAAGEWQRLLKDKRAAAFRKTMRIAAGESDRLSLALERAQAAQREPGDEQRARVRPTMAAAVQPAPLIPKNRCLLYEFRFHKPCCHLRLQFSPFGGLATAFRDNKAIMLEATQQVGTRATVEFQREGIDRVLVWLAVAPRAIRICWRSRVDEKRDDWKDAKLIAHNLQFPLRTIEPSVIDLSGEEKLARSRLLTSEDLGPGKFSDLSATLNGALQWPSVSPVYLSYMSRSTEQQDFIEIQPWAMGLAMAVDAPWRRALGLGFLDSGSDLTPGRRYDYRIVGRFRRRDIEETFLGFHTVPLGTPLPHALYLGGVLFEFGGNREVVAFPKIPNHGLAHSFRKGVDLTGRTTIVFPAPVERIVLEWEPDSVVMHYQALSGGLIPGLPTVVDSGPTPNAPRTELAFSGPVTRLILTGRALLYGLRIQIVAPGVKPEDIIELDAIVSGIRYEPTPPPKPPPVLGTVNLQAPLATGDPMVTTRTPPNLIGFKLSWLPPPGAGNWPPGLWPQDLAAALPMEVVGFNIERRRIDTGESWKPFDLDPETKLRTTVGAARGNRKDPEPLRPGDELLEQYPAVRLPVPPVPVLVDLEDVLLSRAKPEGPPPGSLHQYRIRSVDAIGRRSAVATV